MPASGGEPELILERRPSYNEWTLWRDRIVYVDPEKETGLSIDMLDPDTGGVSVIEPLGPDMLTNAGLSVSPDGEWVLYTRTELGGDIMLVEGLR